MNRLHPLVELRQRRDTSRAKSYENYGAAGTITGTVAAASRFHTLRHSLMLLERYAHESEARKQAALAANPGRNTRVHGRADATQSRTTPIRHADHARGRASPKTTTVSRPNLLTP
jgi:hypothetical protein